MFENQVMPPADWMPEPHQSKQFLLLYAAFYKSVNMQNHHQLETIEKFSWLEAFFSFSSFCVLCFIWIFMKTSDKKIFFKKHQENHLCGLINFMKPCNVIIIFFFQIENVLYYNWHEWLSSALCTTKLRGCCYFFLSKNVDHVNSIRIIWQFAFYRVFSAYLFHCKFKMLQVHFLKLFLLYYMYYILLSAKKKFWSILINEKCANSNAKINLFLLDLRSFKARTFITLSRPLYSLKRQTFNLCEWKLLRFENVDWANMLHLIVGSREREREKTAATIDLNGFHMN